MGFRKLGDPPAQYSQQYWQGVIGKINQTFANTNQTSSGSGTVVVIAGQTYTEGVWYSGVGTPPAVLGNVGDFYFATDTETIYGPKTSTGWGTGIVIGSGGSTPTTGASQIIFTSPGLLAIQAPAAPYYILNAAQNFSTITSIVGVPPSSGNISFAIRVGGVTWMSAVTIGQLTTTPVTAGQIAANQLIELDVTGVGTGLLSGADLTVIVR